MGFNDFFDEPQFDYELERNKFIDNMNMLRDMTVQESVLYKKWVEVNQQKFLDLIPKSRKVKAQIWKPTDIYNKQQTIKELENLKPSIRVVETTEDMSDWGLLRVFCHSMSFDANPGRNVKFLVYDEVTGKYLGVTNLGSDVMMITCRDNYIGWSSEDRIKGKMLRNTTIGSCIMSTQPFGYNFLGGKLVASILTSKYVRDIWKKKYDDVLAGFTTTSLYGSNSMYNGIPYWHKCGKSAGKIAIKPDDSVYKVWHKWLKDNKTDEYKERTTQKEGVAGPKTGIKQLILNMIFKEVGIKVSQYQHGFQRGVYFAPIYKNTKEYLQRKIDDSDLVLKPKFEKDIDGILDWWKPKAIKRYTNLLEQGRLNDEILYYNQMCGLTWEEAKKKFLGDVGR